MTSSLTEEQINAINAVLSRKNVFITGSPGTGKSFTLKIIKDKLKELNINYAITASTGCSAVLINGQTIHSYLGIGICNLKIEKVISNLKKNKSKYNKLRELECIIIDEISMIDDKTFEYISDVLCSIKDDIKTPFGGIQVILIGDFCQLLPVKGMYCFTSELWDRLNMTVIILTKLIRQSDDNEFQNILEELRFGSCSKRTFNKLLRLKDTQFINYNPTKLYSLNSDVDAINNNQFKKLVIKNNNNHEPKIIKCYPLTLDNEFEMKSMIYDDTKNIFKFIAYSNDKTIILEDYNINLIKGLMIMITRNIDFEKGLINGTIGIIENLSYNSVSIIDNNMMKHTIYYHKDINENNGTYVKFMPIKLAYALSIHKSQGATLDAIEVDGSSYIFAPGQLYTALSRVRNLSSIKLINLEKTSFMCHNLVKDFYKNKCV